MVDEVATVFADCSYLLVPARRSGLEEEDVAVREAEISRRHKLGPLRLLPLWLHLTSSAPGITTIGSLHVGHRHVSKF